MEIPRFWRTQKLRYKDLGKGTIYTFTENLAIIELKDKSKITAPLTDFDYEPEIGEEVECVTRKYSEKGEAGLIIYGYKFRPVVS